MNGGHPMTPVQQLALQLAMHLDALSDAELMALQDAITAERKRRLPQKRKPTLIWDLDS
jgi:hypothetical protein